MKLFRKMIYYKIKKFSKKSKMELNLTSHLKYKLENSSSFDVSKVASLECADCKSTTNRLQNETYIFNFLTAKTIYIVPKTMFIFKWRYRCLCNCQFQDNFTVNNFTIIK